MRLTNRAMAAALAGSLMVLVIGAGCSSNSTAPQPTKIQLQYDLNVSGQPLQFNQMIYTNSTGTKYSISKLRFVLCDIVLHAADGKTFKIADMHYWAFDDKSTQVINATGLPQDDWNSLSFIYGLDETRNVRDKYINMTKFHQEMQWPTGMGPTLGYHYMQLEGNYEETPGGSTTGYTTHTGAHQLQTDPEPLHYYFTVTLPFAKTSVQAGKTGVVTIHADLNGWYTDHNPDDGVDTQYDWHQLEGTQLGQEIMSNPDAQAKLQANGPGCFSATMTSN